VSKTAEDEGGRHPQDKLWEMRFGGRDGIARAIYVTAVGRRVVVVHAFVKCMRS
jgi:phage-related protein